MSGIRNTAELPPSTSFRRSLQKGKRNSISEVEPNRVTEKFPSFAQNTRVKLMPLAPLRPPTGNPQKSQLTLKRTSQLQKPCAKDSLKTEDSLIETARTTDRIGFQPQSAKSSSSELNESFMFTSFYKTESSAWIRPSDYLKQIKELNLLDFDLNETGDLEIKLSDNLAKNLEKVQRLFKITEKWNDILRRAVFYTTSQKTNTDKLSEELKYWRELAAKFDSLEYEFNNEKTKKLEVLMEHSARIKPDFQPSLREFQKLKEEVVQLTRQVKKVQLCFEERLVEPIELLQESSSIMEGISLLRQILVDLNSLYDEHRIARNRQFLVSRKININAIKRLLAGNLSPAAVANPSRFKDNFQLLDQLMSFFSHFLSALEDTEEPDTELIDKVEYQRTVVQQLTEILSFSEYLQKAEEGKAHAKQLRLLENPDPNIFDPTSRTAWETLMNTIRSMESQYPKFLAEL